MGDSFNRDEFVAGYLAEADEHLQAAGQNLLRIEAGLDRGAPQPKVVRELFRSLHTLKGLSAMVGVEPIVAIAHEMETILRHADQRADALPRPALELLIAGLSAIEQRVRAFSRNEPVAAPPGGLIQALQTQTSAAASPVLRISQVDLPVALLGKLARSEQEQLAQGVQAGSRALRIDFSPTPEKAARGLSITTVRERVGKLADIVKVLPTSATKSPECPGGLVFTLLVLSSARDEELAEAAGVTSAQLIEILQGSESTLDRDAGSAPYEAAEERESSDDALRTDTIRVEVERLDDALERLSGLVVNRFRLLRALGRLREQGADVREMDVLLGEFGREMKQLRAAITRARMVSVDQLLERVPLLVRGMSKSAGKQVRLTIDAGRSELDKGVADRIFPAIMHLVRNAIDHAIEPPEERARLGKPAVGVVTIRAHERSDNQLELSVSDDGAGVDRERVARKAGQPIPEDDATLLALITRPGLSTQEQATERSGRGMGMDIVKRVALGALGGELTLKTTRNVGTTFTLRVPLSISILDSISFRCGEQIFVAPVAMIEEIVELSSAQLLRGPHPTKTALAVSILRQREIDIPLFDLKALFGIHVDTQASAALIVRRAEKHFAFAVDKMLNQQELVIRPLEDPLVRTPGGSRHHRPRRWTAHPGPRSTRSERRGDRPRRPVWLAAEPPASTETRASTRELNEVHRMSLLHVLFKVSDADYALPASEVLHMETFTSATRVPGSVDYVAGLVQIRSRVVPVIDLRVRFGLSAREPTLDSRVLVVQWSQRVLGLLADSAREVLQIDPALFKPPPDVVAQQAAGFVASIAQVGARLIMLMDYKKVIGEEVLHGNH